MKTVEQRQADRFKYEIKDLQFQQAEKYMQYKAATMQIDEVLYYKDLFQEWVRARPEHIKLELPIHEIYDKLQRYADSLEKQTYEGATE